MAEQYVVSCGIKMISGGQSGADRAGLDWAIDRGVAHGGWCPKGSKSKKGLIDPRYALTATPGAGNVDRTEWKVRDSDVSHIFTQSEKLDGGSKRTVELADKLHKPWRHFHPRVHPKYLASFLAKHRAIVVNVAGKRESVAPGIGAWVCRMLDQSIEISN